MNYYSSYLKNLSMTKKYLTAAVLSHFKLLYKNRKAHN